MRPSTATPWTPPAKNRLSGKNGPGKPLTNTSPTTMRPTGTHGRVKPLPLSKAPSLPPEKGTPLTAKQGGIGGLLPPLPPCFRLRRPLRRSSLRSQGSLRSSAGLLFAAGPPSSARLRLAPILRAPLPPVGGPARFGRGGAAGTSAPPRPRLPLRGPPIFHGGRCGGPLSSLSASVGASPSRRVPGRPRRRRRGTRERLARPGTTGPGFAASAQCAAVDVRMTPPRFSLGLHPVSLGKTKEMGWNWQHNVKTTQDKTASSSKPKTQGRGGTPPLQKT